MKIIKLTLFTIAICFLFACKKNEQSAPPEFPKSIDNSRISIGYPYTKGVLDSGYYHGVFVYFNKVKNVASTGGDIVAVIGGDIAVPIDSIQRSPSPNRIEGAVVNNHTAYWPKNIIYYTIDASVPNTIRIFDAIADWENKTSFIFVPRTNESNYVTFTWSTGTYASAVGFTGGQQFIYIQDSAPTGWVIHEIGHIIGLIHEHTRADRDNFIIVHWANISSADYYAFWKYTTPGFDVGASLDFNSIMIYPSFEKSTNGQATMTRLDGSTWTEPASLSLFDRITSHFVSPFYADAIGNEGQGAGVAFRDINGNGSPEIFLMANDAPSGLNNFHYRVGFDINTNGKTATWSSTKTITGLGNDADGADIAIGLIDNNSTPDVVLMHYDDPSGANSFRYKIGYNLNSNGDATSWSSTQIVTGLGNDAEGAGMTLDDVNNDGLSDIVLMAYDAPSGANNFRYKIGYSINSSGAASSWSSMQTISGLGDYGNGAGIAFSDFDNNGTKDIVLMAYDNPSGFNSFRYKVGMNVNSSGVPQQWLSEQLIRGVGDIGQGAGITMFDVDGNGVKDIVLMGYDNPAGTNNYRYRIGFNPNSNGVTTDWR